MAYTYTGTSVAATVARNVNSGGNFPTMNFDIYLPVPILFESWVQDCRQAGSYTFKVDGVTLASATASAAQAGVTFTPAAPVEIAAGKHLVTISGPNLPVYYNNAFNTTTGSPLTGTGLLFIGWDVWQESAGSCVPGTLNFKTPDGVLVADLVGNTNSGATTFAVQEWDITFGTAVVLVGFSKRVLTADAGGYGFSVDGTVLATAVKTGTNPIWVPYPIPAGHPLAAGARRFKVASSAGNKSWSYNPVATTPPTGDAHVTAWGVWLASTSNKPAGRVFFTVPPPPPGEPTSVTLAYNPAFPTTVGLYWDVPASGGTVTGYQVRLDGGTPIAVGTTPTVYAFTGLTPGLTYDFEVRATGPGGNSAWVMVTDTVPGGASAVVKELATGNSLIVWSGSTPINVTALTP